MNMQDLQNLSKAVHDRTGMAFQTTYFMDGTTDLKINDTFVFQHTDKFTLTGGAKSLDEVGAFLNGILFGVDY
tara:strand:- start:944 stop:1162 length:219 start_codon:yes stop_codon:yes gene_type:complete